VPAVGNSRSLSAQVTHLDLWSLISTKLDGVQMSTASDTPGPSGLGDARALAHIYQERLKAFEDLYVNVVQHKRVDLLDQ
jgi:hypothetical protein